VLLGRTETAYYYLTVYKTKKPQAPAMPAGVEQGIIKIKGLLTSWQPSTSPGDKHGNCWSSRPPRILPRSHLGRRLSC